MYVSIAHVCQRNLVRLVISSVCHRTCTLVIALSFIETCTLVIDLSVIEKTCTVG